MSQESTASAPDQLTVMVHETSGTAKLAPVDTPAPPNAIILIGGPTASGKSALAMQVARQRNGWIINTDAMQIYAGLPLLTAQPSPADRAEIPHLLYEVTDVAEASSAGKWLGLARAAIAKTRAAGHTPILVGGTGMYFAALRGGLADIPAIPNEVRAQAEEKYAHEGEEKFRAALAQIDPVSAARIERNDRQRLIRAYEVAKHTGKALSEWHKNASAEGEDMKAAEYHLVMPPRDVLYARCDQRFDIMMRHGALDEVRTLMSRNLNPELPAMKILGVRELAAHLRGEMNLLDATAKAQQMTRNYAKRQMTWFRNQWLNARDQN